MKTPIRIAKNVRVPLPGKWDALLLPTLFVLNIFTFSGWFQLSDVATKPWLLMWLYGLAVLVPLAWRDRAPLTIFATQVLAVAALPILPYYVPVAGIPVALYAVTVHRGRRISLFALLVSFLPNELAAAVAFMIPAESPAAGIGSFVGNSVFLCLVTIAAWCAGLLTRASKQHIQRLQRERERLQRERETALEAVAAERRSIARELHDIVSHAVTVIVLQAAGAARVAGTDFTQVITSLGHIQRMGEQAMAELGRLLSVLQAGDIVRSDMGLGDLGPQSGLAEVPVLLDSLRAAGMSVAFHIEGETGELDPSVELAAYRVVREGLTNVLKHAGKNANTRLQLVWEPQTLLVQIDNDAVPVQSPRGQALSTGRGLMGLHERVHAAGGYLRAGLTQRSGGYQLTATFPVSHIA